MLLFPHLAGSSSCTSGRLSSYRPEEAWWPLHRWVSSSVEQDVCVACHHLTLLHHCHRAVIKETPACRKRRVGRGVEREHGGKACHTCQELPTETVHKKGNKPHYTHQHHCAGCSCHLADEHMPCSALLSFLHSGWWLHTSHRWGVVAFRPSGQYKTYWDPNSYKQDENGWIQWSTSTTWHWQHAPIVNTYIKTM